MQNLFAIPRDHPSGGEIFETLHEGRMVRIERIVSRGHATPPGQWYDQSQDEWVALLQGSATLGFADRPPVTLSPGDHVFIPARCRHRVERTSSDPVCVWLAVHIEGA